MKTSVKMSLRKKDKSYQVISGFSVTTVKSRSFRDEAVAAARQILQQQKEVILFLDNRYETLVMLESFLATGKKFEVAALSFVGQPNPIIANWQKKLKKLGLQLQVVTFDFSNAAQRLALERLQSQFDVMSLEVLFNMWAACHFDAYVVFSGEFCLPTFDAQNKITSWGLPRILDLAQYDFAKMLGAEAFFMASTHGLFRSQAESAATSAYLRLNKEDKKNITDRQLIKEIFYRSSGMKDLLTWPVDREQELLWKSAMRFADRNAHEEMSRIINATRMLLAKDISHLENPGALKVKPFDPKNQKMQRLYRQMKKHSSDLHWVGGARRISEEADSDSVYAAFPLLMTEHRFHGDMDHLEKTVKALPFYRNMFNYISATDLQYDPQFKEFINFVDEKVRFYFDKLGWVVYEHEITHCWANRAKAGETHHPHRHPNSIISGILYLNDGGGGDTVFAKETAELSMVHPRRSRVTVFNSRAVNVRPNKGTLILFPSYLTHEVMTHESTDEDRYTVSFNIYVRGVIGDFNEGAWVDLRKPV